MDEGVASLPEHPRWPHALLRTLFEAPSPVPKRLALVQDGETPVGLVGLRKINRFSWEPITNYIVPGFIIAGDQDLTAAVLSALPVDLHLAWWRMPFPPPSPDLRAVRSSVRSPTYILPLGDYPDTYWRQTGHSRNVRNAARKSSEFDFHVNPPGSLRWAIDQWDQQWRCSPDEPTKELDDRKAAAAFLEARGQYLTFTLQENDRILAAEACVVDGEDLVSMVTYRRHDYDQYLVGFALFGRVVDWATAAGYTRIDIGGEFDYKRRWAPPTGQKYQIQMCPPLRYHVYTTLRRGRAVGANALGIVSTNAARVFRTSG